MKDEPSWDELMEWCQSELCAAAEEWARRMEEEPPGVREVLAPLNDEVEARTGVSMAVTMRVASPQHLAEPALLLVREDALHALLQKAWMYDDLG